MRPKDLKSNFTWETRTPLLKDKILYVPAYYSEHEAFVMPSFKEIFGNEAPVAIEYCTGNGDWIIEKAKKHPEMNWIAVEKLFERVRKIYSKRENHGVNNLLIVCGEAFPFTKYYLQNSSIQKIYINFPDPWPKRRHAKHRVTHDLFIQELSRVVVPEGSAVCVTDDAPYCQTVIEEFLQSRLWQSGCPDPFFIKNLEGYGYSFFESLWKKQGKDIYHMQFKNLKSESL
jgi:tRNA (guanine-N7-)-methyltransferase